MTEQQNGIVERFQNALICLRTPDPIQAVIISGIIGIMTTLMTIGTIELVMRFTK